MCINYERVSGHPTVMVSHFSSIHIDVLRVNVETFTPFLLKLGEFCFPKINRFKLMIKNRIFNSFLPPKSF